jgi:SAM-dependent methyltransferase
MKKLLKTVIGKRGVSVAKWLRNQSMYRGRLRYCPICAHYSSKFRPLGIIRRENAQCVWCGSKERHRLVWLFFQKKTDLSSGTTDRKVLHVAPEECFTGQLRKAVGRGYLTADLLDPDVDVKMDVTDIQYPDNSFDVIYCSHVLEHVPDDRKAMQEFHRVLKSEGWAILLVPITADKTIEDASIADENERLRLFGQVDHARRYGPDYAQRLADAGFKVSCVLPKDFLSDQEIELMGITKFAGEIYLCEKGTKAIS